MPLAEGVAGWRSSRRSAFSGVERLSAEGEAQALDTLESALQGMLEPVEESLGKLQEGERSGSGGEGNGALNENGFDGEWRASLGFCRVYMEGQRDIIRRALEECGKLRP